LLDATLEVQEATREEMRLKQWRRQWKVDLVERSNP